MEDIILIEVPHQRRASVSIVSREWTVNTAAQVYENMSPEMQADYVEPMGSLTDEDIHDAVHIINHDHSGGSWTEATPEGIQGALDNVMKAQPHQWAAIASGLEERLEDLSRQ